MGAPTTIFDRHQTRRARARAAARIDQADFLHTRCAEEICDRLAGINRTFSRILLLGDVTGQVARTLRPQSATSADRRLVATDSAPAMLARRRTGSPGQPPMLVCEEELLPFADSSFDLIVSILSLHKANDLPGALIQLRRSLKPDGLLLASLFGATTLHELRQCFLNVEARSAHGVSPHVFPFADVRDMGSLLQRAGFAMPVTDSDEVTVSYRTAFDLMRDLRAMGETNSLVERRRTFLRRTTLFETAQAYAQTFPAPNGKIRATFEILNLTAWAPGPNQPQPLKPGSASHRLADALNTTEIKTGVPGGKHQPPGDDDDQNP